MPATLTMPKLSPTMEEGTITKWRKRVGDQIKPGDVLFEVATDKATVEHAALDEGWLKAILIQEGQSAIVNQPVAIFTERKEEGIEGYVPEGAAPRQKPAMAAAAVEERGDAPASAPVQTAPSSQPSFIPEPPLSGYEFPAPSDAAPVFASPLARKLAKEKGIDLSTVKGSGPHHRIVSEDLDLAQPRAIATFGSRQRPAIEPGSYEEEALSPLRKKIGQRLQESKTFIPHFYVTQEIDAVPLSHVREQLKEGGIKVSFNDLIVRAAALSLRDHPHVNSGFNSVNQTLIRFKTIDISIAVSMEGGLITPIIRHADYKNLGQIASEIKVLAKKAREGKLAREEYMGGSFTISNLGMYGISSFSGIINPPQAALLAVGGIEEKAVVKEGKVVPGKTLSLTLSADHRVIDGADAAAFLKTLRHLLENPALLLVS